MLAASSVLLTGFRRNTISGRLASVRESAPAVHLEDLG
jgi:hypothetical protein